MKDIKELIESYDNPKELIGDLVGWASLFVIVFLLSIVGY